MLLNTGSGWTQDTNITSDTPTYTNQNNGTSNLYLNSGSTSLNNYIIDLNGDGMLDYIHASSSQINGVHYPIFAVLYNQDNNLEWDNSVSVPWITVG